MKTFLLFLVLGLIVSCKQKKVTSNQVISNEQLITTKVNDTNPNIIVRKIFSEHIKSNSELENSISLFNQYSVKIEENYNPVYLTFKKCSPFINKKQFNDNFKLLDITEWNEELFLHKHFFYEKEGYIFIIDTFNDSELSEENKCFKDNKSEIIEQIRIYTHAEYLKFSKKSIRQNFSKKIK